MNTVDRSVALNILSQVRVAKPCPMKWDEMQGDDRVRHCAACDLQVYNFSNMSPEDAAALVVNRQGRLCAGFFQRADGTMIVEDCPVGMRAAARRAHRWLRRGVGAVLSLAAAAVLMGSQRRTELVWSRPFETLAKLLQPFGLPQRQNPGLWLAGDICIPPTQAPAAPAPTGGS